MFRRKRNFGTSSRKMPQRKAYKTFQKKRRTWRTCFFANLCNVLEVELVGCGSEEAPTSTDIHIALLSNQTLEESFTDRVWVKRIVGDLWMQPVLEASPNDSCEQLPAYSALSYISGFAGVRRREVNADGQGFDVHPLTNSYDYSESGWRRTWQHEWTGPQLDVGCQLFELAGLSFPVVIPNVHTTGAPHNVLVDGSGDIEVITEIAHDCRECSESQLLATFNNRVKSPPAWHLRLDLRKSFSLRENQELMLDLAFVTPFADVIATFEPNMMITGQVKMLTEF